MADLAIGCGVLCPLLSYTGLHWILASDHISVPTHLRQVEESKRLGLSSKYIWQRAYICPITSLYDVYRLPRSVNEVKLL